VDVVEALIKQGAYKPSDKDNRHWTPLFWAGYADHESIVQSLLKVPFG
jgi:ankyrin repeat protein